jgi:hypothetical protein
MEVAALLVAGSATLEDGAINALRIPTTNFELDQIPMWLTVPVIVVVHAPAGADYDPEIFVVCKDPTGERRGAVRSIWHWPDEGKKPSKYRCFAHDFSFAIESEGEYTIGVYSDADATNEIGTPIPVLVTLATDRLVGTNGA